MTQHRLVLIRHAKAQDPEPGQVDHARSLTDKGVRDARALGRWLKQEGVRPDVVLCSTAARTRETWAGITEGSGFGTLVDHEQRIYNASADALLAVLREVPDKARTVVLIGHAPGVPVLAAVLTEGTGSDVDLDEAFHTCGSAILEFEGAFSDLTAGAATLTATHLGRA